MNNSTDFSEFSRQSPKGIIIIYFIQIVKLIKSSWYIIPALIIGKGKNINLTYVLLGVSVLLIYLLIRSILLYMNFKFKVNDNHFILKQGVFKKMQTSIPFERIQNVNFKQNIIHQFIDITQVEIETAGAKTVEISIKALDKRKAEALKLIIFNAKNIGNNIEENEENKKLFKISINDLFKVSVTENHFRSFAILIAFVSSIYYQIKDFLKNSSIDSALEENFNQVISATKGILIVVLLSFLVSILISFVRIFSRHFDLVLAISKDTLEIQQGLFTKRRDILKKAKVQNIVVSTNPFKKIIGISNIVFKQATNNKLKLNKLIKIVGCKEKYIEITKDLLFGKIDVTNQHFYKPEKYFIFQNIFKSSIFIFLVNLLILMLKADQFYFINLVLVPITGILIYLQYKRSYFKINEDILVVGSGQISTETIYFEFFKIQSISLRQTIFQKRKNVTDLILQTASSKIRLPCVSLPTAIKLYDYILYKTEISKRKWM